MGLLHPSRGRRALPGCLCGELLPWRLASGGLTSGLLGTRHLELSKGGTQPGELNTADKKKIHGNTQKTDEVEQCGFDGARRLTPPSIRAYSPPSPLQAKPLGGAVFAPVTLRYTAIKRDSQRGLIKSTTMSGFSFSLNGRFRKWHQV